MKRSLIYLVPQWDELHEEGERFRERLMGLGKDVRGTTIMGVPHGYDRSPNAAFKEDPVMVRVYGEACQEIKRVFDDPSRC